MNVEPDLEKVALQESRLRFSVIDNDLLWKLGELIKDIGEARGFPLAIEIRIARETVFYYAMSGTTPSNAEWVRRKRNTVELMHKSSYSIGLELKHELTTLEQKVGLPLKDYATHGGSFPIMVHGLGVTGVVTVSGATEREDHAVIVEALAKILDVPLGEVAMD